MGTASLVLAASISFAEVDVAKKKVPVDLKNIDATTANDLSSALGDTKGVIIKVKAENAATMEGAELRLTSDDISKNSNLEKAFEVSKKATVSTDGTDTQENYWTLLVLLLNNFHDKTSVVVVY